MEKQEVIRHFREDRELAEATEKVAAWPRETMKERIGQISEMIDIDGGFDKVKFRIVLEYDPKFERAIFSVREVIK